MDEHRIGLQLLRRRPRAAPGRGGRRAQWTYLYGFARPATSGTCCASRQRAAFSAALRQFATATGAGTAKRVVLVLDGAGCTPARASRPAPGPAPRLLPSSSRSSASGPHRRGSPARLRRPRRPGGGPGGPLPHPARAARSSAPSPASTGGPRPHEP
ncbi:MAG: hypothetical protein U0841_23225 [Chloroflexia bacterium]